MKKLIGIIIILQLLLTSIAVGTTFDVLCQKTTYKGTLYVGGAGPGNYTKIQDAIDNATTGDTIYVYNGIYTETVHINTTLSLIGEDNQHTILDADDLGDGILISKPNVKVDGFTIQHAGKAFANTAGIRLEALSATISHNIIKNNEYQGIEIYSDESTGHIISNNVFDSNSIEGIDLSWSENNQIINNTFINNDLGIRINLHDDESNQINDNIFINDGIFFQSPSLLTTVTNNIVNGKPLIYLQNQSDMIIEEGGQIVLVNCTNVTIQNVNITNTSCGIQLLGNNYCTIKNNNISHNMMGIWDYSSLASRIIDNQLYSNSHSGISSFQSASNEIRGNSIIDSNARYDIFPIWIWPSALDLFNSYKCVVSENRIIANNYSGLSLAGSFRNTIENNWFENNGVMSIIIFASGFNRISQNTFINNGEDPYFYVSALNYWKGNYWDEPRILPKIIHGELLKYKWINVDWRPAQAPIII
ncbi:MAG: right-handed parallel beta-helix repeat-containing protein [Candidatus Thermoplasmatota archaeon]|nr:right-handed parallel beta-helix repeat-containing protein [Candidatus Thermoplasmatota archaeon]